MHPLDYANQQSNLCAAVQDITFTTAAAVTAVEVAHHEQNRTSGHLPIRLELSVDHFGIRHEEKFHDWRPIQNCIHRGHDLRQGFIIYISQLLRQHAPIHSINYSELCLFIHFFLLPFLQSLMQSVSHELHICSNERNLLSELH